MQKELGVHLSDHRLEGSLCDTPLTRVLAECFDHQVTGAITVCAFGRRGTLELRAGAVDRAEFDGVEGDIAVDILSRLRTGTYEVAQRLPDLGGTLGSAAELEGSTDDVPLVELMRYCEENALTCRIVVIRGFDRAEISYRAGDIAEISLNGERDEDRIVDIVRFERARFRVSAPPLDLDIEGWPATGRAPTAPFALERDLDEELGVAGEDPDEREVEEMLAEASRIAGVRVPRSYLAASAVLVTGLCVFLMMLAIP